MARSASQPQTPDEQPVVAGESPELAAAQAVATERLQDRSQGEATLAGAPAGEPYTDAIIDAGVQANYRAERLAMGLSWTQLAERFDRMPDAQLARWARASGRHEAAQARGADAAPAGRQSPAQARA